MPRGRSSRARWPAVLTLALGAVLVLTGCEYLYGYGYGAPDPDEFAMPTPVVRYVEGAASLRIGDAAAIELSQVGQAALYPNFVGGEATWGDGDGMYVRISGATTDMFLGSLAYVTIDRVRDGKHWSTADPTRCVVTIDSAEATGLRGSATCKGLRWIDAISSYGLTMEPRYVLGEDPFDAEIRFEALPSTTAPA